MRAAWWLVPSLIAVGCNTELTDRGSVESVPLSDLTPAVCTNRTFGYVRNEDLNRGSQKSPEEAIAQPVPDAFTIPCYAEDGVTVIGEFEIGGAVVVDATNP